MQARDPVDDVEDDAGTDEGVCRAGDAVVQLVCELDPVVVEPATVDDGGPVEMRNVVRSEESGEDIARNAADGVQGEDVKRVVDLEPVLDLGAEVAGDGGDDAEDDCGPGGNVSRGGGDADEAGDDA